MSVNQFIPIVELIDQKRGPHKEFLVTLFEQCNLACSFCLQDHDSTYGMDTIPDKVQSVIQKVTNPFFHQINVTGGELFHDGVPDWVFDEYMTFCRGIHQHIKHYAISFTTNFIFTKQERVLAFLLQMQQEGINVDLCSSYDPRGRFNSETLTTFMENVVVFTPHIRSFQVTMTKPTIKRLQSGVIDTVFEYLYDQFTLYFDHYTPGPRDNPFQCTEAEIVDFYIYMLGRYPNIEPLKSWQQSDRVETTCRSTVVIGPDGVVSTCRALLTENPVTDYDQGQRIKEDLEVKFVDKYNCTECDYFSRCALSCFLHNDSVENTDSDCQYKRLHHYLLTSHEIPA